MSRAKSMLGEAAAHLATTTIFEEHFHSLSSPTGGKVRGEEADFIGCSPALSPLVPRGARGQISPGCIKMQPAVLLRLSWTPTQPEELVADDVGERERVVIAHNRREVRDRRPVRHAQVRD